MKEKKEFEEEMEGYEWMWLGKRSSSLKGRMPPAFTLLEGTGILDTMFALFALKSLRHQF